MQLAVTLNKQSMYSCSSQFFIDLIFYRYILREQTLILHWVTKLLDIFFI